MATSPTQVRVDTDIKNQAAELFKTLGLDVSSAINIFLHQCVLTGGIPFRVELPQANASPSAAKSRYGIARGAFRLPPESDEEMRTLDQEIAREFYGMES